MDIRQGFPGELPEIPSGWASGQLDLVPGEGFWDRIEQIAVKGDVTRGLDTAMGGKASPRIWLFLHEPGRGEISTAVAMSFARELAFRDQAALVLDGDDRDFSLTRWVGRVESEGWIDLTRYGTSVLTSGIPMPFVGRRGYVLGVGSFAPTDVTRTEIDTLLVRLRRQADDLLIVAPADSLGLLWAPSADIRIMCWDRSSTGADHAGVVALDFAAADCPLTAVVSFEDSGGVEEKIVEDVFAEMGPTSEAPGVPEGPLKVDDDSEFEVPEIEEPVAGDPVIEADSIPEPEDEWRDFPLEERENPESADGWDGLMPTSDQEQTKGTSRVFWFGAVAALVVIAAISVYYLKFVRVPAGGHFEQINIATETQPPVAVDGTAPALADSQDGTSVQTPVQAADSLAVADSTAGVLATDSIGADVVVSGEAGPPITEHEEPAQTEQVPEELPVELPAVFDLGPYTGPVGEKGWALHVYSLPDAASTAEQVQELERRGFQTAVKVFDLGEKGRWLRIYLGSFATRTEAKDAMPALLEKLREDWAKPERFTISAPE